MTVIALDTASPLPSVALVHGGRLFEEPLSTQRRASEDLLPALAGCLGAAGVALEDCERIAVCSGPGSFTGVRIGLATAWALRRALGVPLEAVSTLAAMAEAAREAAEGTVATALDAGRGEVVLARYRIDADRALEIGGAERIPLGQAQAAAAGAPIFCLPHDLVAEGRALPRTPCAALALAVNRAPRPDTESAAEAIYSRPSAAEEKRGAS